MRTGPLTYAGDAMSTADDQELFRPLSDVTGVDVSMHIASIGYSDAAFDLPARLREHAAAHEELAAFYEPPAAQQAHWAKDLREAAAEIIRLREAADKLERAESRSGTLKACHMDLKTIIDRLRRYNRWRRGGFYIESDIGIVPQEIGEAIDAACDELERIAEPAATQALGHENGAERLCRILYGRSAEIGDTIGGLDAQMLHDAYAEIERMRKAVLPEDD